ncbi:unnamed protein product [Cylicostephanus goldi]|uniref:Rad21/Rec8-like protein N-terminal domain-containing protein n=1 Tax=Cylicostephanus goldi TaxID=71465 RepID=A0A3P6QSS9_CYLGO|nr:unnamed protein product [Cylicostephanus goldi]
MHYLRAHQVHLNRLCSIIGKSLPIICSHPFPYICTKHLHFPAMFYAQFVLSKKGPLARIWLAAHWEKKLSKAQICETDLQGAVNEIVKPKVKMALRTTGHLLLGIVRIYSRKVKYLLADCNETFLGIRNAFRTGRIETADEREAGAKTLSLPEVYRDFDSTLPDLDEMDFENHLQVPLLIVLFSSLYLFSKVNQSRIGDITLLDEQIPAQYLFDAAFENDEFGDIGLDPILTAVDFNLSDFPPLPNLEETRCGYFFLKAVIAETIVFNRGPFESLTFLTVKGSVRAKTRF